ncbi:MAG: hypothetical protein MJ105_03140 [Lachnospiraceae bacterium]|nr:hypothetical protein [Lachnospiraceae bacterium]
MGKTVGKIIGQIVAVLAGLAVSLVLYFVGHVTYDITIEAGEIFGPDDFYSGAWTPKFTDRYEIPDNTAVGVYPLEVKVLPFLKFNASVTIVDTVAPVLSVQDISLNYGETAEITDFIVEAQDVTPLNVYYETEPDFTKAGEQELVIYAMDAAGNTVSENAVLSMSCVYDHVTVELGEELPDVKEYLVDKQMRANYMCPPNKDDLSVGDYYIRIKVGNDVYRTKLTLIDTTAPTVSGNDISGWINEPMEATAFIASIEDASPCEVTFVKEPDFTKLGKQTVKLLVTDTSGNQSEATSTLNIQEDTTGPVIICNGISATVGTTISYRSAIAVTDNHDGTITNFNVDTSAVDITKVGDYVVVCTAVDQAGNQSSREIVVSVKPEVKAYQPTLEDVYAQAEAVLLQIITPGMDKVAQVTAIYNWTRSHISYRYGSDKTNWVKTAYEGFTKRNGDCFTYAAVSMAMLNRLGINCMFIKKEQAPWGTQSQHYWLLVDYGAGYYHYDSCPRRTGYNFCLIGDVELWNYSNNPATRREEGSHNFTRELYPPINP